MVAFSLYRGNLRTVPDVPRRWLMPTPKISLKHFRLLLDRRNRALARLQSSNPSSVADHQEEINGLPDSNNDPPPPPPSPLDPPHDTNSEAEKVDDEEEGDSEEGGGGDCGVKANNDGGEAAEVVMGQGPESAGDAVDLAGGSLEEEKTLENPNEETTNGVNISIEAEKRKKEIEEKLQILNEKKHGLVKVLKQVLNTEEVSKRNNTHGAGTRPSVSLQVDVSNDSGSMTRHPTPRLGSNGNLDTEAGESDNASNQNAQSRHLHRMSSVSPCSDSLHRKPFFSSGALFSRANAPLGSSPSSLAQASPANPPTVSVSALSYIASSPSPAGSGGTSAFRVSTLPSPRPD